MDIKYAYSVYRLIQMILIMTISLMLGCFGFICFQNCSLIITKVSPIYPNKNIVYDVGRIILADFGIIISQLMMCVICLKKEVRKQHYIIDGNSR